MYMQSNDHGCSRCELQLVFQSCSMCLFYKNLVKNHLIVMCHSNRAGIYLQFDDALASVCVKIMSDALGLLFCHDQGTNKHSFYVFGVLTQLLTANELNVSSIQFN